jgi:hypothetical protein
VRSYAEIEDKTYVELRIAASGATQTTATVVARLEGGRPPRLT